MSRVIYRLLAIIAIYTLADIAVRLLYQNTELPMWACLLIATAPAGTAVATIIWIAINRQEKKETTT